MACTQTYTATKNHQQCEPKENLEILLIFFFCILFGVARLYVHGYTAPNGIITQPRVKQSSVDFAFSRLSSDRLRHFVQASGSMHGFRFGVYRFFCFVELKNVLVGSEMPSFELHMKWIIIFMERKIVVFDSKFYSKLQVSSLISIL